MPGSAAGALGGFAVFAFAGGQPFAILGATGQAMQDFSTGESAETTLGRFVFGVAGGRVVSGAAGAFGRAAGQVGSFLGAGEAAAINSAVGDAVTYATNAIGIPAINPENQCAGK